MNDSFFMALLFQKNFFGGNQMATLNAKATEADKAMYFLDEIIARNITDYFKILLDAMEEFGVPTTTLAREIKRKVGLKSCPGTAYFMCVLY